MNNLPSMDDMLAAIDAEAVKAQEAWGKVAALINTAMKQEADALNRAKLAIQDGAVLRGELTATLDSISQRLQQHADIQP